MALYIKSLDHGSRRARWIAHVLVSAGLTVLVAVPLVAVGAQFVG
jgi:hypothetical protein